MKIKYQLQRIATRTLASVTLGVAILGILSSACAETVVKMSLGGEGDNMQFAGGVFSLLSDGLASTPGDRNVSIDFVLPGGSPLSSLGSDGVASLTLNGMNAVASPTNTGSFIIQSFNDGNLAVYGTNNALLLSADLSLSAIQGALGPSDSQALFLAFGEITGGSLAWRLDPDSLQVRIKYPTIDGGFSVSLPPSSQLASFTTRTSTVEIMATVVIPEPAFSAPLLLLAAICDPTRRRLKR